MEVEARLTHGGPLFLLFLPSSLSLWQEGNGKRDTHRTFAIILCLRLDCTLAPENPFLSLFFFPQLSSNRRRNTRRLPSTFIAPKRSPPRRAIIRPVRAPTRRVYTYTVYARDRIVLLCGLAGRLRLTGWLAEAKPALNWLGATWATASAPGVYRGENYKVETGRVAGVIKRADHSRGWEILRTHATTACPAAAPTIVPAAAARRDFHRNPPYLDTLRAFYRNTVPADCSPYIYFIFSQFNFLQLSAKQYMDRHKTKPKNRLIIQMTEANK